MGMIANYQQSTDQELERLKCSVDLFEEVETLQENEALELCDIDKMWDALHFLLTGRSAAEPVENNLISEAITGQFCLSEESEEGFATGTHAGRVKEIAEALRKVNIESHIETFCMDDFAKNDIYPSIWEYEEETDEIKEDLKATFESLKDFYGRMAEKECAVLVSIY